MKKSEEGQSEKEPEKDDEEQSQRFVETARQLGADEDEEEFERAIKRITDKPDKE